MDAGVIKTSAPATAPNTMEAIRTTTFCCCSDLEQFLLYLIRDEQFSNSVKDLITLAANIVMKKVLKK